MQVSPVHRHHRILLVPHCHENRGPAAEVPVETNTSGIGEVFGYAPSQDINLARGSGKGGGACEPFRRGFSGARHVWRIVKGFHSCLLYSLHRSISLVRGGWSTEKPKTERFFPRWVAIPFRND
jgi:hypothetical protein